MAAVAGSQGCRVLESGRDLGRLVVAVMCENSIALCTKTRSSRFCTRFDDGVHEAAKAFP
jgi:hypothetical protein